MKKYSRTNSSRIINLTTVSLCTTIFLSVKVQNCLARTAKFSHITPILRSLHWLKIKKRVEYELLSLIYRVLTTSQPHVEPAPHPLFLALLDHLYLCHYFYTTQLWHTLATLVYLPVSTVPVI